MQLLNGRQRVAAASLLKRRPAVPQATCAMQEEVAYRLWYALVWSEMQRVGVVEPNLVREFCARAGVPIDGDMERSAAPPTAA